eukprot:2450931-Lingulodinium_polyedra.AAC.1
MVMVVVAMATEVMATVVVMASLRLMADGKPLNRPPTRSGHYTHQLWPSSSRAPRRAWWAPSPPWLGGLGGLLGGFGGPG